MVTTQWRRSLLGRAARNLRARHLNLSDTAGLIGVLSLAVFVAVYWLAGVLLVVAGTAMWVSYTAAKRGQ